MLRRSLMRQRENSSPLIGSEEIILRLFEMLGEFSPARCYITLAFRVNGFRNSHKYQFLLATGPGSGTHGQLTRHLNPEDCESFKLSSSVLFCVVASESE